MNTLKIELPDKSYNIYVGSGLLSQVDEYFNLNRKVFILTDSGVPLEYAEKVKDCSKEAVIYTIPQGEDSKSLLVMETVLKAMLSFDMSRKDVLVAVGGGVVGDLGGFLAATYMRGIDFYNVPTTLLSQVDSSIGGKTAVNLGGIKNIVGAFHQPKAVLIDTDTLKTLPKRQIAAGSAEAVKMALTSDKELFELIENCGITENNLEEIIVRALKIKKFVVEKDEKENGLRKILNFGHTLGHGIEAEKLGELYHGECVALGMLYMCAPEVQIRLTSVLKKLGLPVDYQYDIDKALEFVIHDKKCQNGFVEAIFVPCIGEYEIKSLSVEEFKRIVKERTGEI